MTTKQLECAIFRALEKMGTYLCFEVMMPTDGYLPNERVDLLSYDTKGTWRFYELKISKSDFYSKSKHTFLGHLNYYVMPIELYEKVKENIPSEIGVYVAGTEYTNCKCIKKAKRKTLGIDENNLKHAFIQALSREHSKYRFMLREESKP
jgi:hypothetical protein